MSKTETNIRRLGSDVLMERFPQARQLWSLTASNKMGYTQAFSITAYAINGVLVILQEFAEHGWDIYVPASPSAKVDDTMEAIAKATARTGGDYRNPTV